jgi:hypothetical protein
VFRLLPYLGDPESVKLFAALLDDYRIDLVIVGPDESADFHRAWERLDLLRPRLAPAFEQDGYAIYTVNRRAQIADGAN